MATETLDNLRTTRDRVLRTKLLEDPAVARAIARVNELTSGYGYYQRRRLLTSGIRLTRRMYPTLAETLGECKERLQIDAPVEIFVRNEPIMSASCARAPSGLLSIMLTSRLIEAFTPTELRFVIGHELGHARFDHFAIPMPITATIRDMAGRLVSRSIALEMFVWCRAAEISADRAGLVCARDADATTQSFFKLASGLTGGHVASDVNAFAAQVEALAATPEARAQPRDDDDTLDCFSTHPYGAVRVRALLAFAKSALYQRTIGGAVSDEHIDDETLGEIIERDLAVMEPTYLEEKTSQSENLRRLLYEAGVSVAAANGAIEESELEALRKLLGPQAMLGEIDIDSIRIALDKRVAETRENAPFAARAQLVQHLTIVAAADGVVCDEEFAEMRRISVGLGIDPLVIEETLAASAAPMD